MTDTTQGDEQAKRAELISRLEVEQGSRELSDLVLLSLGYELKPAQATSRLNRLYIELLKDNEDWALAGITTIKQIRNNPIDIHELSSTMVWYHPGGRVQLLSERPDPTRSVDDTKLLQPDGYAIRLSVNSKMTDVEIYNKDWMGECSAKTEENARSIAILKAHNHENDHL